jgi:hypothetical protein
MSFLKRILTFCVQNPLFIGLIMIAGGIVTFKAMELRADANEMYTEAVTRYGGDRIVALTRLLDDESNSYKKRNNAVSMLANLSDARALPVLEKYWTGSNNASCGNGEFRLCQYDLKRAVKNARENAGPNIVTLLLQGR